MASPALTGASPSRGGALPTGRPPMAWKLVGAIAALKLLLHVVVNATTAYGIQRDEFLYMAMGERLRLWGMDFPPMIALLSELARGTMGHSMFAIRMIAALFGTAVVVLAAVIARELGGGRGAQALAATAVVANVLFLRSGNLFQPVVVEQCWWALGFLVLVRMATADRPRWWLALGAILGVGLLTKFSVAFFGLGITVAILATPMRRAMLTRWPWVAFVLALAIGAPSIVGQIRLGFPVVTQMRELREVQLAHVGFARFFGEPLLWGVGSLIAAGGLATLLFARWARPYRAVGIAAAATIGLLAVMHGKPYYAGPVYPALIAAGAVALTRWKTRAGRVTLRATWVATVTFGLVILPLGVPLLPPPAMERYLARLGNQRAVSTNTGEIERLPQDYADMLGWPEEVDAVARAWHSLSPREREVAVVVAQNYGEAGAVDFYGRAHGLPRAVSVAGSYWFFGPGDKPGEIAVVLGGDPEDLTPFYADVRQVEVVGHPYAVREERHVPVFIARAPKTTLQAVWPRLAGQN